MRKVMLTLCILAVMVFYHGLGSGLCASRFTDGFQGVKWSTPKDKLPDLGISEKGFKNIYAKGPSAILFMEGVGKLAMQFDDIPLIAIYLRFEDAVFTGFDFVFKPEYHDRIRAAVEKDMGQPGTSCEEGFCWREGTLEMTLTDRELLVAQVPQVPK